MGLYANIQREPVSELSLRDPVIVGPSTSLRDAILRMRKARLGCAVVLNNQQHPIGLFTEAMLRGLLFKSLDVLDDPMETHMATTFPWVAATDPIQTVLDAMETKNSRFVVVVDGEGKIAGLTGQKGLMEYVAEHFPREVMVQRIGTKSHPQQREGA